MKVRQLLMFLAVIVGAGACGNPSAAPNPKTEALDGGAPVAKSRPRTRGDLVASGQRSTSARFTLVSTTGQSTPASPGPPRSDRSQLEPGVYGGPR